MVNNISFDTVKVGDVLPPFDAVISRTDIVKYAGAGGDFNPLHHDEEIAKAVGLPSVFAMGLLHGGMLARIVTGWAGPDTIRRYKIRFKNPVWPGEKIVFEGHVTGKTSDNGENIVHCDILVKKPDGTSAIEGDVDIMLPSINVKMEN